MKLIQTKDYLLLIDEKAEIKDKEIVTDSYGNVCPFVDLSFLGLGYDKTTIHKVIAYYPLTKEAEELDLPLLPSFEEPDVLKMAKDYAMSNTNSIGGDYTILREAFEDGYKAAQSKQFSLEDMKEAIDLARRNSRLSLSSDEITQSLSTQQLPKEFIPEYEAKTEFGPFKLKIITNSEGKEEIQGTYKY